MTANNGSLTLNNTSMASTAGIAIAAGSQIMTLGTGGDINIYMGATPATNAGSPPTGVNYTINGVKATPPFAAGTFLFGNTNTGSITVSSPAGIYMNIIGSARLAFSTGTLPKSAITIAGGTSTAPTVITADPPYVLPGLAASVGDSLGTALPSVSRHEPGYAQGTSPLSGQAPGTTLVLPKAQFAEDELKPVSAYAQLLRFVPAWTDRQIDNSGLFSQAQPTGGLLAALLQSDIELGLGVDQNSAGNRSNQNSAGKHSSGAMTGRLPADRFVTLGNDALLLAPASEKIVQTRFGNVRVDAGSLVLIVPFADGLAVYDLDDQHRNAVSVSTSTGHFGLFPGMSLALTTDAVGTFAEINPAQAFAYRNIAAHEIGGGLRAFSSEFYVPFAIRNVLPLSQLALSSHPNARRLMDHLLRTTAATMHLRPGAVQFQLVTRPIAAWNQ